MAKKQRHYGHINKQNGRLVVEESFVPDLSDFVTFETNFRDGFLNQSYVGLNLYLIRETRRFCRQVNKKISSCFWTASTCVQRSSLG